ncbi:unnamed protein product [Bursaphelenchus xylophilus]|uniref:(pine wood nematode) hypothetical protein n=1 Tax=Bursaphelenchus xylophilus TaxID=6326 RepID=A0A1I7SGK5_BURXY|nr:unnamed protein product [Bursaphelenchus xylophilus]CAG9122463.1 unnamed protein product [Bursaphelenchus xylophilus]
MQQNANAVFGKTILFLAPRFAACAPVSLQTANKSRKQPKPEAKPKLPKPEAQPKPEAKPNLPKPEPKPEAQPKPEAKLSLKFLRVSQIPNRVSQSAKVVGANRKFLLFGGARKRIVYQYSLRSSGSMVA